MDVLKDPQVTGTALQAVSQYSQGESAKASKGFEAEQLNRSAKARGAAASREAYEERRRGRVLQSNIRAAQAAGGGTTTDPGAISTLAKAQVVTDYNALSALYQGEVEAEGLRTAAKAREFEGKSQQRASRLKSLATIVSGGAKLYGKYKK